jgi:hypothetical protein
MVSDIKGRPQIEGFENRVRRRIFEPKRGVLIG